MHILLLEDDIDLGQAVAEHLEAAGHETHWCKRVAQARAAAEAEPAPELALLDLNLPDGDGLDLLRDWRAAGRRLPAIVLTARDQVSDRIRGLRAGADDYLVKPFDLDEMLARIAAVCRRHAPPPLLLQGLRIDLDAHRVLRGATPVDLTGMEWTVLACLARQPGRIYSRDEIEARLSASGHGEGASNSLEVIVSRLRRKLGAGLISTHRGLGYRLDG